MLAVTYDHAAARGLLERTLEALAPARRIPPTPTLPPGGGRGVLMDSNRTPGGERAFIGEGGSGGSAGAAEGAPGRDLLAHALGRAAGLAAHFAGRGEWPHFALADTPEPELPGPEWLKIGVQYASIDPAEIESLPARFEAAQPPPGAAGAACIPGGAVVGTVLETGPAVETYRPGDRVAVDSVRSCAARGGPPVCPLCERGLYHLCRRRDEDRVSTGAWAERVVAHRTQVQRVPLGLSSEEALFLDDFAHALHAALKAKGGPERLAVVGLGAAGLTLIGTLRALGQRGRLVALGPPAHAAEWAFDAGADFVVRATADADRALACAAPALGARLVTAPGGRAALAGGADLVFETTGTDAGLALACRLAREGGTVVPARQGRLQTLDWTTVFARELTLRPAAAHAAEYVDGRLDHAYTTMLAKLRAGEIFARPWLTHAFALVEYERALTIAVAPESAGAVAVAFKGA